MILRLTTRASKCAQRLGVRRLDAAFAAASALFQGGVKPPHSKALRAFSWFLGAAGGMSDCFLLKAGRA